MTPPPPQRGPPPKPQTSKPPNGSQEPIRDQFRVAKHVIKRSGDGTENERRRNRKQKEDGRQLFSPAKAMVKRLARAAGRTWRFFWERETHTAPSPDMHLDPRYADWYAGDPDARGALSADYDYDRVAWPSADFDSPSLNL
jgi:hypothetical protein